MRIQEVAGFLGYSKEQVETLIAKGMKLPASKKTVKLIATKVGTRNDVSDTQLDRFIRRFENEEPGRHPPVAVRRELLVEARHRCAICTQPLPPQFHHMLEWSKVKHHDPSHMLVLCGGCHDRCRTGEIDYRAQVEYKARLRLGLGKTDAPNARHTQKRQDDLKTLRYLFSIIPRPLIDQLLEEMNRDRVQIEHVDMLDSASEVLSKTTFYLSDKELWRLLRGFFKEWTMANDMAPYLFHDNGLTGVGKPLVNIPMHWHKHEEHEQFHQHVLQARHAFSLLNTYVRDQYPEFDLDESDRHALDEYWKLCDRVRRQTEKWKKTLGSKSKAGTEAARKKQSRKSR